MWYRCCISNTGMGVARNVDWVCRGEDAQIIVFFIKLFIVVGVYRFVFRQVEKVMQERRCITGVTSNTGVVVEKGIE